MTVSVPRRQLVLCQPKRKRRRKKKRRRRKKKRRKKPVNHLLLVRENSRLLLVGLDSQSPEKHRSKFVHPQVVLAASRSEYRVDETTAA